MSEFDELIAVFIQVLSNTKGWQLVVIFLIYAIISMYRTFTEDRKLRIMQETIHAVLSNVDLLLRSIDGNIARLSAMIEGFLLGRLP